MDRISAITSRLQPAQENGGDLLLGAVGASAIGVVALAYGCDQKAKSARKDIHLAAVKLWHEIAKSADAWADTKPDPAWICGNSRRCRVGTYDYGANYEIARMFKDGCTDKTPKVQEWFKKWNSEAEEYIDQFKKRWTESSMGKRFPVEVETNRNGLQKEKKGTPVFTIYIVNPKVKK